MPPSSLLSLLISKLPKTPHTKSPPTQIRHPHNLNNQTRPSGKMLCSLSLTCFRVILFPRETGFLPGVEDGFCEVQAQTGVQVFGGFLVRAGGLGDFLEGEG